MSLEPGAVCRVAGCVALPAAPDPRTRNVCTIGVCAAHQTLEDFELRALLRLAAGLVGQLEPITDRIEYDEDGLPVRFYPETRRA